MYSELFLKEIVQILDLRFFGKYSVSFYYFDGKIFKNPLSFHTETVVSISLGIMD